MYTEIAARLRKSKLLLEEALKYGYVESQMLVCLLIGVAGAGKTHTKHLLLGCPPPESTDSTPLAVRPVRAIRVSTQGGHLQEISPDELDAILAGIVTEGVRLNKNSNVCCCIKTRNRTTSSGIKPRSIRLEDLPYQSTSHKERCCYCCLTPHSPNTDAESQGNTNQGIELKEITNSLNETARHIATKFEPNQHLKCDWIYLIDSGGQIEFLEILPAFLQHALVCLFVMNLSQMLSERPEMKYFENGQLVGEPMICPFTNGEMLMRCVQTIQTQWTHHDGSTNPESNLVIVGTHRDKENECSESREKKNQILRSILCPQFNQSLVFHGLQMKELVFPINAKNPGTQDKEVASKITEVITNAVSSLKPRKTPISWFKLEQHIQKEAQKHNRKVLHREECLQVSKDLHLSERELYAALDHLAKLGVIHYYWHLLPDVVFIDTQFLLDKISEVVKYHYRLRHGADSHSGIEGEWSTFRNEGCISLNLLKQFPKNYTTFFTPPDFLNLMKDRLIVTQSISSDKYFMPCLLRTMESEEVDEHRASSSASGVAPLAIHFSCGWVPHGVFCSLVAYLRSSQSSDPWKLSPSENNPSEPLCLTRNCIKFQLPEGAPGSLTLIDAFSHFEVYINNAPHDIYVHLCPSIWQTLVEGIQKVAETLKYQLFPKQAFLCKHENTQPHLALPAAAFDYWKCKLNPNISGSLEKEHKLWLPKKGNM